MAGRECIRRHCGMVAGWMSPDTPAASPCGLGSLGALCAGLARWSTTMAQIASCRLWPVASICKTTHEGRRTMQLTESTAWRRGRPRNGGRGDVAFAVIGCVSCVSCVLCAMSICQSVSLCTSPAVLQFLPPIAELRALSEKFGSKYGPHQTAYTRPIRHFALALRSSLRPPNLPQAFLPSTRNVVVCEISPVAVRIDVFTFVGCIACPLCCVKD